MLRQRSLEALRLNASRGELSITVPVGYVRTRHERVEFDQGLRIHEVILMSAPRSTRPWHASEEVDPAQ